MSPKSAMNPNADKHPKTDKAAPGRLPPDAVMYAAVAQRDATYDETFFYGVVTTGVFCLPSCAARPARPENLRFFATAEEASAAGLRPCKRCRPLDARDERERLTALARRLASDPEAPATVAAMARSVAMSPSRFQKRFKSWFGVNPGAFRAQAKLAAFKQALAQGASVTRAMAEANFGSSSRAYAPARNIGMTPSRYRAGGSGETIHYAARDSNLGPLLLAATDRGVCFAQFGPTEAALVDQLRAEFPGATLQPSAAQRSHALDAWMDALNAHLAAEAPRPEVPLDLRGTAFQLKVWRFLLGLEAGTAISYGELAKGIDQPSATRAAASACGANRVAVLVPCHRVLRSNGELGGYRWGLERKRALLALERTQETAE